MGEFKPILFSTPMVQAILAGKKSCTRRVMNPQPIISDEKMWTWRDCQWMDGGIGFPASGIADHAKYKPGDILWVRETWKIQAAHRFDADARIEFKAGGPMSKLQFANGKSNAADRDEYDAFIAKWFKDGNWKPSIYMQRAAARIFLRVTDVGVERIQDITESDAQCEGIRGWTKDDRLYKYAPADQEGDYPCWPWKGCPKSPVDAMERLWDDINAKRGYGWAANPWVWVVRFERITKEEAYAE